ncbi:MAG: endonuclease III domain-containing protein [Bacillota bacterium]
MREHLLDVFNRLLDHFGPRHWWPAETPFEVVVGAILTQQVSWRNVEKAISKLKEAGCLSPQGILAIPEERLWELIRATRFYRQKAARLREFCRMVVEEFEGNLDALFALDTPVLRGRLLAINGIGEETADSIILYAAQQPVFVIDNYTKRIMARLGWQDANVSYAALQRWFTEHLPRETALYNEYHALIDALGHNICLKERPRCGDCPLNELCLYTKMTSS